MKVIKYSIKVTHKGEIVIGAINRTAVEEALKKLLRNEKVWDMKNTELIGIEVDELDERTCPGVCERCSYFCPNEDDCMIDDFNNRCADCEYLCPKCGSCTLVDGGECGDDECKKCHWRCNECGKCIHPEGEKQS